MGSEEKIKTTVTLPSELHWKFHKEVANRRVSNTKAIQEAMEDWVYKDVSKGGKESLRGKQAGRGVSSDASIAVPDLERLPDEVRRPLQRALEAVAEAFVSAFGGKIDPVDDVSADNERVRLLEEAKRNAGTIERFGQEHPRGDEAVPTKRRPKPA
jgi:hypothetical protein